MEGRVRQELLNALQTANQRIQEAIDRLNERQSPDMRADRSADTQSSGEGRTSEQQESVNPLSPNPRSGQKIKALTALRWIPPERRQEVHPDDISPAPDTGHRDPS
jgi:hypothetical protein